MDNFTKDLGTLVRKKLKNEKPVFSGGLPDVRKLAEFASENHMMYFLLSPLMEEDYPDYIKDQISSALKSTLKETMVQVCDINDLEAMFEENGIKNLFMKGSRMKFIYPAAEMREMSDIDVLIFPESFEKAAAIMEKNGYTVVDDIKQHRIFRSPLGTVVEAHYTMCEKTTDKTQYEYFLDYSRLKLRDGMKYSYEQTLEDFYVYMIAHMARHFYVSGCGIRNLVDIFVFLEKYGNSIDMPYIERELEKLHILDFYGHMKKATDIWLGGEESTEFYDNLIAYMEQGGTYGYEKNGIWNRFATSGAKEISKRKLKLWFLFPPLCNMAEKYPILEEHPSLLPIMWVRRGFESVFNNKDVVEKKSERRHMVDTVDEDTIRKMSEIYRKMNFRFSAK